MQEFSNLIMQLSTESIQEKGQGQNILPLVGPSRNHSVVNGWVNGPRDKIISFIKVNKFSKEKDGYITGGEIFGGDLKNLEGLNQSDVQNASLEGTFEDMIENGVPAYKITMPELNPYHLAKLIAHYQHAVAIEGELRGLRAEADDEGVYVDLTYLQSAVEGYKTKTREHLAKIKQQRTTIPAVAVEPTSEDMVEGYKKMTFEKIQDASEKQKMFLRAI
jgi:glucose-6-phosphate isomerase